MIIRRDQPLANDHPSPLSPLSSLPGSRFNLADLSRTICSCCITNIFLTSHLNSKYYVLQLYLQSHPFPGKTNCLSEAAPIGRMPFTEVVGVVASRSRTFCTFGPRSDIISAPNLQVFDAAPGTYYLLLEARKTLDNLGLTLTLGDSEYLRLIS